MNDLWKDREKINQQSIKKTLISMALPAIMSTFFTIIFEIIDMIWVGQLGPVSVAALSASSFFVWMLRGLAMTVATGAIALVSRRAGEKDEQGLLKIIMNSTVASLVFSISIIVLFFPICNRIFQWINLEPEVGCFAKEYAMVFLSGMVFVCLMITFEYIIRGLGDTKTPMVITGISLLLNAILDPIFIFTFKMGLKGAALATILAQMIGAVLMAIVLLRKIPVIKNMKFSLASLGFKHNFFKIVMIGGPIALSEAGFSFIYLLLSGIISIFGKEPLAAIGIAHRLESLPFFISLGFSMAVAPIVGQNLGAGNIKNAKETVFLSLKIGCSIVLFISIVFLLFAPHLFSFFINDAGVIQHGANYLRIISIFEVFLVLEVILSGAFSGAGDTKPPFFIVFPITASRIPFAYLFAVTLSFGVNGIWWVIAFTTFLKGIILLLAFKKGKWAKKKV
jgi:putative MATE family efflux protein